MAQPSVASFFNTRKRAAAEDVAGLKNKRLIEPSEAITLNKLSAPNEKQITRHDDDIANLKSAVTTSGGMRTRSGRTVKRIGVQKMDDIRESVLPKKISKIEESFKQQKLVQFIKKGPLSPRKKQLTTPSTKTLQNEMQTLNEQTPVVKPVDITDIIAESGVKNVDLGLKTPTKQIIKGSTPIKHGELKNLVRKELNFDEVKSKISRSAKLQELKASLSRIQELEKTRKAQEERNRLLREGIVSPVKQEPVVQLKEFDTIELEVLTSPSKTFKTPTKLTPPTPDKNELMSPRHTNVSKRVLFSPSKNGSPSKVIVPPAYQRFLSLAETNKAGQLPLPFKYRHLIEIFKGVDSVCAMLHNRKECITFKKLKPAVQRMLRKNLSETHLAQIKFIYPEAFIFTQMKMRNYGSASKADYFQLVISPNVENLSEKVKMNKIDEDNVLVSAQSNSMNPQIMTERLQRFQNLLLQRVKDRHEEFLKSLDPPLLIHKDKITRWHPDFELEKCPDVECAHLPQPPNVEKYSSARDILSTARNLFNCATPMERALERYEARIEAERIVIENQKNASQNTKDTTQSEILQADALDKVEKKLKTSTSICRDTEAATPKDLKLNITPAANDVSATLLKGLPKSLLEKVRAKQAAKAMDAITRRPSQDQEATMYSRLPELARHLRNVFITERKGVLTLEVIIRKIQNSFRTCLTSPEIEAHLRLIAKEVPSWIAFHEVRKTMYLKISKDMDLSKVVVQLEAVANEKSK